MNLFKTDAWLKAPADRDLIAKWTVGAGKGMSYALDLPAPPDGDRFEFLALGDTGDSEAIGPYFSPQDAVAAQMAADAALPGSEGRGQFVLHMGDVVYMTGERRLYDRNFRRPYSPFLTPESTVDGLVFRLPFLPVPGNHDYYDLGGWAKWLAKVPILGAGLRALTHELFAFSLPEGGSDMGRAYMDAFVDRKADTSQAAYAYRPGERTRLPNRYYRFRYGSVDFIALDSNTLDAPPPEIASGQFKADATTRLERLEKQAHELDLKLRKDQLALDRWRTEHMEGAANDPQRLAAIRESAPAVLARLARLRAALERVDDRNDPCRKAADAAATAERRWNEAVGDLNAASSPSEATHALRMLEEASDEGDVLLRATEGGLSTLGEGSERAEILAARDDLEQWLPVFSDQVIPTPKEICARLHQFSEDALDVQRELATERRRARLRPEDYDAAQLEWLEASLAESERANPDGWRIVYMHHPLYTTTRNHSEKPELQDARDNLLRRLQGRVHLVLTGHSHAFEWFRSDALPHTGIFVTGGGGQISLKPSLLEPRRLPRYRDRYDSLRRAGVVESVMGGRGPAAADGEDGPVYHYLRVEVAPETLTVRPVGVRRLEAGGYRREEPMPVFHAPEFRVGRPEWTARQLRGVLIRRDAPPEAVWEQ